MFGVVFPHSLVQALPPQPPPWGNGSIRRTRCKLNRSRERGRAGPQCPPVPHSAPPLFPLSVLVARATLKCRFVSEAPVSFLGEGITLQPPRSPRLLGSNIPSVLLSAAPRLLDFCPGTPYLRSRILPLNQPLSPAPPVFLCASSSAYTRAPESSVLKQTSLAPCCPPPAAVVCCSFLLNKTSKTWVY